MVENSFTRCFSSLNLTSSVWPLSSISPWTRSKYFFLSYLLYSAAAKSPSPSFCPISCMLRTVYADLMTGLWNFWPSSSFGHRFNNILTPVGRASASYDCIPRDSSTELSKGRLVFILVKFVFETNVLAIDEESRSLQRLLIVLLQLVRITASRFYFSLFVGYKKRRVRFVQHMYCDYIQYFELAWDLRDVSR